MKYVDKEEDINECTLVLNGCHLVLQLMIIHKIDSRNANDVYIDIYNVLVIKLI